MWVRSGAAVALVAGVLAGPPWQSSLLRAPASTTMSLNCRLIHSIFSAYRPGLRDAMEGRMPMVLRSMHQLPVPWALPAANKQTLRPLRARSTAKLRAMTQRSALWC